MLYIIRGLPGAGKTTFAKALSKGTGFPWVEADQFMINKEGEYEFDPDRLQECHQICQEDVKLSLELNGGAIVSNTFTRKWEMKPYINFAKAACCPFTVLTVEGNHGSVHNVPISVIERMKARWESYQC